jgi:hypothetical protein
MIPAGDHIASPVTEDAGARKKDKKKPEILRSRAKSTKGGGWRRQLGMLQISGEQQPEN